MTSLRVLNDVVADGCSENYCTLRAILKYGLNVHTDGGNCNNCSGLCEAKKEVLLRGIDDRFLMQAKMVEKLKFERGLADSLKGWDESWRLWYDEGHGIVFRGVYERYEKLDENHDEIYAVVMQRACVAV